MIVKICSKHGELTESMAHKEKNKQCKLGFRWRCNECKLEKDRRWKSLNWEQHKATAAKARNKAREDYRNGFINQEPKANIWSRQYRKDNPEKHREWEKRGRERLGPIRNIMEITRVRGISLEEYYEIKGKQDGKCAICGLEEKRKSRNGGIARLCLDHNHTTGQVRSLLCHACNQVVGHSKESIEILKSAIQYLESHEH
jgi:Recombination endonuclease VII